jgi:hypothetical protein
MRTASRFAPVVPGDLAMSMIKKAVLVTTLAASALVSTASPVMARDYYRDRGDNTAAVAIGVGILGLAVGAIAASSNNDDRRYRDGRYYDRRARVYDDRSYRGDYYDRSRSYDRGGYQYDRRGGWDDRYYSRRGY